MAELVYRNKPMFDYIFENDLYNTDGLVWLLSGKQELAGMIVFEGD